MLRKMGMNVVFLCCVVSLLAFGVFGNSGASAQSGIDSFSKLVLHADGSDQGTSFTDSSSGAKTVANTETYDSYTKLMLHTEGSGNIFVDSAASKAVTANGNVTQTTAQYKLGSRSTVFDGSGDYLSLADSNDWDFGSGDFTIDFWVRFSSVSGVQYIFVQTGAWQVFWHGASSSLKFNSNVTGTLTLSASLSATVWYHVAFVRVSGALKCFVDGVQVGDSLSNPDNITGGTSLYIGDDGLGTGYLNGWIDELRISKGIARWTSDFTPPSSPYGKVATVTSQKKFGTASGEFKGSGDYLSLADSDDFYIEGDFTTDFWIKFNVLPTSGNQMQFFLQANDNWQNTHYLYILNQSGVYTLRYVVVTGNVSQIQLISTWSTPVTNTWYHIAIVRNGNAFTCYVDGISIGTSTTSATYANLVNPLTIGAYSNPVGTTGEFLNGWMDEFRWSKGIARWTSNFTPPSAPYETDTTTPTVSSTSPAGSATGVGVSSAISATFSEDMDSSTITTSTFTLSSSSVSGSSVGWVKRSAPNKTETENGKDGFASLNPSYTTTTSTFTPSSSVSGTVSYSNKVATFTPSSNLSYSTIYTATITTGVKDAGGNAMSSNYTWSFTTGSAPDTTAPSGSVTVSGGSSYTNSTTITLNLSATDNVGVTGYYLSDSSTTPSSSASGWTSVTSTTSYSGTVSYSLSGSEGSKTIYAWYKDAAGNVSTTANATITYDTTVPTVTISSPTSSSTYTTTTSTISLGGSASDSSSGIGTVTWSNNRGGNGTATGTASWTVSSISLSSGDNVITVTAKDGAGNSGTDTLQVTYSTGTTVSVPTVSTGSASSVTTSSATLNGTVNANGVSTTAWFNYGTTSGSYGNTSSTQTVTGSSNTTVSIGISGLSSGTKYYYRIAASNSGGTSYGSESSFTTSSTTATPTPSPTATTTPKPSPTAQPTPTRPPTLPPLPTPQVSPTATPAGGSGSVYGTVTDGDGQPLSGVTVTIERVLLAASQRNISVQATSLNQRETIVGANGSSPTEKSTETDENGYYEFSGLSKGNYNLTYEKDGYQTKTKSITLGEGEEKDIGSTVLEEEGSLGKIYGYVVDIKGNPLESVKLKLKGLKTGVKGLETSDGDGFFEFLDLGADRYILTVQKKRYRKSKKTITLEEGESREIEIEMRKTSKRMIDERQTTEAQRH